MLMSVVVLSVYCLAIVSNHWYVLLEGTTQQLLNVTLPALIIFFACRATGRQREAAHIFKAALMHAIKLSSLLKMLVVIKIRLSNLHDGCKNANIVTTIWSHCPRLLRLVVCNVNACLDEFRPPNHAESCLAARTKCL